MTRRLKILPTAKNLAVTRRHIFAYDRFWPQASGLYTLTRGNRDLVGATVLGGRFIWKAWQGFQSEGGALRARDLFLYSLIYLSDCSCDGTGQRCEGQRHWRAVNPSSIHFRHEPSHTHRCQRHHLGRHRALDAQLVDVCTCFG